MMKRLVLLCAAFFSVASAFAAGEDAIKEAARRDFSAAGVRGGAFLEPRSPHGPFFLTPRLRPVGRLGVGAEVGRARLADQLDRHRDLVSRALDGQDWFLSTAGDASFKKYFLTCARETALVLTEIGDLNRLRGTGVDVTLPSGAAYNVKLHIAWLDPVYGSSIVITPKNGGAAPDAINTGDLLGALKAKSYVFSAGGDEYWLLYGTDVDASGQALADTRSFLFIRFAGTDSKAWPLAESALKDGPLSVALASTNLILTKTAQGELVINEAR